MSVQCGRWNLDGKPIEREYLDKVRTTLTPYSPDGFGSYIRGSVGLLYGAFHTTKESRLEAQPHELNSGAMLTWDGRLDNRSELLALLGASLSFEDSDLSIVAAAYERWGSDSFGKLIGDWALSVWDPADRSVVLARDPIGTRHLHYLFEQDRLTWCTILDPLVLLAGRRFALNEEYVAGWLSSLPAPHLTPFVGIDSVPPSSFVRLKRGARTRTKYWDFDPSKRIRYPADVEYEQHFRNVFGESVRRRMRSDAPVLAELSGGVDSSCIVCMADELTAGTGGGASRLHTVSYYDDSDPNWNERPYFSKVEEKRGRTGWHIDVGRSAMSNFIPEGGWFAATPVSALARQNSGREFAVCLDTLESRVVLSGIGGDEVTGGVPTPIPELQNLLARARFRTLAHQLKVRAIEKRTPWFRLLAESAKGFFPFPLAGRPKNERPAPWLDPAFLERNRLALGGYARRLRLFGPLPSFQESLSTVNGLQRLLESQALPRDPPFEKRYPYLDRDLLEFLFAIPRGQLVRPGERRSLMRRSLSGIVPGEVLHRRRKAVAIRAPLAAVSLGSTNIVQKRSQMLAASFGFLERERFQKDLQAAQEGHGAAILPMVRALALEAWLISLVQRGILRDSNGCVKAAEPGEQCQIASCSETRFSAENDSKMERG